MMRVGLPKYGDFLAIGFHEGARTTSPDLTLVQVTSNMSFLFHTHPAKYLLSSSICIADTNHINFKVDGMYLPHPLRRSIVIPPD